MLFFFWGVHSLWGSTRRPGHLRWSMNFLLQLRYIDRIVQQSATAAGDASCCHGDGAPSEWSSKRALYYLYWCSWIGSVIDWGIADKSRGIIQDVPFSRPTLCNITLQQTNNYSPANQHGWLENHQNLNKRYESLDRLLFHCHDLVCWGV